MNFNKLLQLQVCSLGFVGLVTQTSLLELTINESSRSLGSTHQSCLCPGFIKSPFLDLILQIMLEYIFFAQSVIDL